MSSTVYLVLIVKVFTLCQCRQNDENQHMYSIFEIEKRLHRLASTSRRLVRRAQGKTDLSPCFPVASELVAFREVELGTWVDER